jgi:hypothetical protein
MQSLIIFYFNMRRLQALPSFLFHIAAAWELRGDSLFGSAQQNSWMSLEEKTMQI